MHWDPEFSDVKIVQAFLLTTELDRIVKQASPGHQAKDVPLIMCGDYNSLPGSGVAEFIRSGRVGVNHCDFQKLQYNKKLTKMNPKNGEVSEILICTGGSFKKWSQFWRVMGQNCRNYRITVFGSRKTKDKFLKSFFSWITVCRPKLFRKIANVGQKNRFFFDFFGVLSPRW